jgi:Tfp pilus assembly protein PilO
MLRQLPFLRDVSIGSLLNAASAIVTALIGVAAWLTACGLQTRLSNATSNLEERIVLLQGAAELRAASQKLHEDTTAARRHTESMQARLPATAEETQFLQQLSELATNCHLDLGDFRPGSVLDRNSYKELDLRIRARGHYGRLCQFLSELSQLPRFVRVSHLSIAAPSEHGGDCDVDLQLYLAFGFKLDPSSTVLQP